MLVGQQEGHVACKKLSVGLLVATTSLELCMSQSYSCHHHLCYPWLQRNPECTGSPGLSWKTAIKRVSCHAVVVVLTCII